MLVVSVSCKWLVLVPAGQWNPACMGMTEISGDDGVGGVFLLILTTYNLQYNLHWALK